MRKAFLFGGLVSLSAVAFAEVNWDEHVAGEVSVTYATKVLSYGLPDSDDPNFLPFGGLTFFEVLSVGTLFYFDTSHIGERMGRGDRAWDFWEVDFPVSLRQTFAQGDFDRLPTSVELGVGYRYEYHPPRTHIRDTQFWVADVALPDLWIVPRLSYERDAIRDNGTCLNLALSRDFALCESLTLTPSLAQGWGDKKRVRGYLPSSDLEHRLDRAGLMDTRLQLSLSWKVTTWLTLAGYVAYSDFLFDRHVREASRNYIRQSDGGARNRSWTFPCGISAMLTF